jgi:superfamily II DNA or RNA helicase
MSATPYSNHERDLLGILSNGLTHPISQLTERDLDLLLGYEEVEGDKKGKNAFDKLVTKSIFYKKASDYGIKFPEMDIKFQAIEPNEWYKEEYRKIIENARKMKITVNSKEMVINTANHAIAKLSAVYKIEWVKNKILELNSQDLSVLVGASLNEAFIYPLSEQLGIKPYVGDTPLKEREIMRQDFKYGRTKTLIGNFGAISTGVDGLDTNCNHSIMAQPVYSLAVFIQYFGRTYRRNSKYDTVYYYVPYVKNIEGYISIEAKQLSGLMEVDEKGNKRGKLQRFNEIMGGNEEESNQLSEAFSKGMLDIQAELYKQIYNN